jgi:hypothetical protein
MPAKNRIHVDYQNSCATTRGINGGGQPSQAGANYQHIRIFSAFWRLGRLLF